MWLGGAAWLASGSAMAAHVDVAVGLGVPVYAEPPPVYVAPQPAVVAYPGYDGGYDDEDRDRYREWRKHEYKRWHKHHEDDDED